MRKLGINRKTALICVLLLVIIIILSLKIFGNSNTLSNLATTSSSISLNLMPDVQDNSDLEPYYAEVLQKWEQQGISKAADSLEIKGIDISNRSDGTEVTKGTFENEKDVLQWKPKSNSWIEFQVDIKQEGLYQLNLNYHPFMEDTNGKTINFNVKVDGANPFREARATSFQHLWRDVLPLKKDSYGDDIRPKQEDISGWMTNPFRDSTRNYATPLQWLFPAGKHTIRLTSSDAILIKSLTLTPPVDTKPYIEVAKVYPPTNSQPKQMIVVEAENMAAKSDSTIQMAVDTDPLTEPKANGHFTFNYVGSYNGGEMITWKIQVPESGRYKLALRTENNRVVNKSSFRTIYVDGKVPFKELYAYRFPYSSGWKATEVADNTGVPYEFYLEKGEHTISSESTSSPVNSFAIIINKAGSLLKGINEDLKKLTAGQGDSNRTWVIERDMPDLPKRLRFVADQLKQLIIPMSQVNGQEDGNVQQVKSAVRDLESLLQYPDEIPGKASQIVKVMVQISSLPQDLAFQPLMVDRIYMAPVQVELPNMEANIFQKTSEAAKKFFRSFGDKQKLGANEKVLNVWMLRGRDYVNLLQEYADQQFTPETGVKVKINLIQDQYVLLNATAAGIQPDVAIGLLESIPTDLAMRHSAVDLSKFPDFKEVLSQFSPGTMLPLYYDHGYYGLPETQSFNMLFYRKDILNKLGLKVPQTWDDVYAMLPILQQHNMNFALSRNESNQFFYQNGAEIYTPEGTKSGLDSPQAFKAFKQWTDMYSIYGLDVESNFYQHFRDGDMPIGIADFSGYLLMKEAAPELNGSWGIAPWPGTRQADGSIARWASASTTLPSTVGMITQASKQKDEAWAFLKWWMSTDVQAQFGQTLEASFGPAFRWNTANVKAFTRLPWTDEELNTILDSWSWLKQVPNVPGGYYTGREISNAWNRTVVDGMNYRVSLEQAIKEINRELLRKQREFKIVDAEGKPLKSLDLPQIIHPWEGAKKNVDK